MLISTSKLSKCPFSWIKFVFGVVVFEIASEFLVGASPCVDVVSLLIFLSWSCCLVSDVLVLAALKRFVVDCLLRIIRIVTSCLDESV